MKIAAALLSFLVLPFAEASEMTPPVLATAVQQLRQAAGRWNVTTTRYAENGAVAAVATGTLNFDWVVPDRVLAGKSVIPDWNQSAGMLFYLNERMFTLEMAQVGGDGQLIVMSGPAGDRDADCGADCTRRTAAACCSGTRATASPPTASRRRWR